jgi:signal transduction histidine kinase
VAGGIAAGSVALMAAGLVLAYVDRHALPASGAQICLQVQNRTFRFTVSDDGAGYDVGHTPMGSGQRNMADRLAALGGRLEVRSVPSEGTTITGQLPLAAAVSRDLNPRTTSAMPPTGPPPGD